MRKTTILAPGQVIPDLPLAATTRLEMEIGTKVFGVQIQTNISVTPVEDHLTALLTKFARTCAAVASLQHAQCAHALMRSFLGSAKVQYALRTLPLRLTTGVADSVTMTKRRAWDDIMKASASCGARQQATLPLSMGGCGISSASDVAPLSLLAGILQLLANADSLLGSDRHSVVPMTTEAGRVGAL